MAAAGAVLALARMPARADDWLAVWPVCSIADGSRPILSLLYPAPGLPAVVHAGDALFARVRTPTALTPPPGVQQERVLTSWWAEFSGSALHVGVEPGERHRHFLPVVSVRPDGADSLVYRLRIEIPAYVAPGTYAFALHTPFGTRSTEQGVRVIAAGATPRLARLPDHMLLPPAAAGTRLVDVWLAGSYAEEAVAAIAPIDLIEPAPTDAGPAGRPAVEMGSDPAPTLLVEGDAIALRVGSELWVRGGCSDASTFEREVAAVLAIERSTRVPLDPRRAASPPTAAELFSVDAIALRAEGAELDNRAASTARELALLLPFAARASVDHGTLALYPASEPVARTPAAKLARWIVPAGVRAALRLGPARAAGSTLALRPRDFRSGQPARVRIAGADARAKVAFALGFAHSAYASPDLRTRFWGPLPHPVRAQVFETDGAGQVVHGHLWVEPHRPPNCAIARSPTRARPSWGTLACFGALWLALVRRRGFAKKAPPGAALE
jgi:hypothetical protein